MYRECGVCIYYWNKLYECITLVDQGVGCILLHCGMWSTIKLLDLVLVAEITINIKCT